MSEAKEKLESTKDSNLFIVTYVVGSVWNDFPRNTYKSKLVKFNGEQFPRNLFTSLLKMIGHQALRYTHFMPTVNDITILSVDKIEYSDEIQ